MPLVNPEALSGEHFDTVVVGSGFGSLFFLEKLMAKRPGRVLMIEWGEHRDHDWQLENHKNTEIADLSTYSSASDKPWNFTIGLGGGTNCWFAQTPRFHPNDFKLNSLYGAGFDWPITYEDLEPYYGQAEQVMSVAGDPDMTAIFPRSTSYPQPPHRMTAVDKVMKAARPKEHFAMPTARARIATKDRSACCASFRCNLCPVDAKFTANNGFKELLANPKISIALNTQALRFDTDSTVVKTLVVEHGGKEYRVSGDLFVLGANAIQSPAILLRSGMDAPMTGKGLHESMGSYAEAYLDGIDNFDGGTITTGLNYGLYDGPHRKDHGATLVYFENRYPFGLRPTPNRWRQTLAMMLVTEDLLEEENAVTVDGAGKAVVAYKGPSEYAKAGQKAAFKRLPELLAPLPVEEIFYRGERETESHLQGTLRMGADPKTSVIDAGLLHHKWRNLVVVGTSTFTSCSCANPSLTAAALSMRAADILA